MYAHCYDENHSYVAFDAVEGSYNKRRRKGLYEKLFCRICEDVLKKYEDYGKSVLYDNLKPKVRKLKSGVTIDDYDYKLFKLFVLSLLWRSSVSTLSMFSSIRLGKYEEYLRRVLLDEIEIPVNDFPCVLYQVHIKDRLSDGVFMEGFPRKAIVDGRTIYQFIVDGLYMFIGVGTCSIKSFKQGASVSPENLRVGYDELHKIEEFSGLVSRLKQQNKFSCYEKS